MQYKDFIPLASSDVSAEMDRLAQKNYGIRAEILMESAGALSAKALTGLKDIKKAPIIVLCGPGNNGGDGMVMARHLLSAGLNVEVFGPQVATKHGARSLYERQKQRLLNQGVSLHSLNDKEAVQKAVPHAKVVVDALFGVGLSRDIKEPYAGLINGINSSPQFVVSLDTPSGLDVNTGCVKGPAVKANITFSFGLAKPGFYLMEGPAHVGQLQVLSIGFPPDLLSQKKTQFLITKSWVSARLPRRKPADHKAQHGHLLVLAGSEGFWGAGGLTATAGYRMGAGYVTLSHFGSPSATNTEALLSEKLNHKHPPQRVALDVLTQAIEDPKLLKNKTAVAIGPGLEVGERTKKLLLKLTKTCLPVVVDASAWTVCVRKGLFPLPSHWVVTPHSGELAPLFGVKGSEVDRDRVSYALQASLKAGCLVLLKGFHSVLAQKDRCWIIPTGNSALAKAGTGDVLTGFIGALMARGLSAFDSTAISAFVHGLLAEEWVQSGKDPECLMAQDLKEILPFVLQKLKQV